MVEYSISSKRIFFYICRDRRCVPANIKKSYCKLCYEQINVYFISISIKKFHKAYIKLGEEKASLCAFRTFVRFALVWFCLFSLPLDVWGGLQFVIVALLGLLSYLLFNKSIH